MLEKLLGLIGLGGDKSAVTKLVMSYLLGGGKGAALAAALPALINQFKSAGLGHLVESWLGSGPNAPATAAQITSALGADKLADMAKQLGVPVDQAAAKLAQYLPAIIDKLTPGGKLPTA